MANKAVINVDINDSQFTAFYELFQQFEDKLGKMPESWKAINESSSDTNAAIAAGAGALVESLLQASGHAKALGEHLKSASNAQKEFGHASNVGRSNLSVMAKDARSLADSVFGIGKFLFKMSAIGVGAGIAGLFGLDKLAERAVSNQRNARALGMTTGQYRAFDTDLGRNLDSGSLSSVADAQNSYVGRVWLARATGLSQHQVENSDAGTLAGQLALKAHDWWNSTPESQHTDANLLATGFTQSGLTLADVRRQGNTSRGELERGLSNYQRDSRSLNVSDATTGAWYAFSRQLTLAGQSLETKFTNKLSQLGGPLGSLITSVEKDAEMLIDSIFTKSNMDAIASGIDTFAKYLGSQDFKSDVKALVDGVSSVAHAIAKALHLIDPTADTTPGNTDAAQANWMSDQNNQIKNPYNFVYVPKKGLFGSSGAPAPWDKATYAGPGFGYVNPQNPQYAHNMAMIAGGEREAGLPAGFIAAEVMTESSGNAGAVSNKGARGLLQLMPSVVHDYGNLDPMNATDNLTMGSAYYGDAYRRNHGDLRKTIAAGNWGQGNLDKDINGYTDAKGVHHAGHGDDWERFAPLETRNHIQRMLTNMQRVSARNGKVDITITNKSGTNVAISTNAGSKG